MGLPMTMLKTALIWLGFAWVVFIAAITLQHIPELAFVIVTGELPR
jgi:hypothetical protein